MDFIFFFFISLGYVVYLGFDSVHIDECYTMRNQNNEKIPVDRICILDRCCLSLLQGNKCVFNLCRGCCKKKAYKEVADCPGEFIRKALTVIKMTCYESVVWFCETQWRGIFSLPYKHRELFFFPPPRCPSLFLLCRSWLEIQDESAEAEARRPDGDADLILNRSGNAESSVLASANSCCKRNNTSVSYSHKHMHWNRILLLNCKNISTLDRNEFHTGIRNHARSKSVTCGDEILYMGFFTEFLLAKLRPRTDANVL